MIDGYEECVRVSRIARQSLDRLGQLLEQWLADLRAGYTIAGD